MRSLNNMMYTTKEIQRQKLLNTIDKNEDNQTPAKVDKIKFYICFHPKLQVPKYRPNYMEHTQRPKPNELEILRF